MAIWQDVVGLDLLQETGNALTLGAGGKPLIVLETGAVRPVVPVLGSYFIAMFKDTPLLAAITVTEMLQTAKLIGAESFRYLEPLTLTGAVFLAVSLAASYGVRSLERHHAVRH